VPQVGGGSVRSGDHRCRGESLCEVRGRRCACGPEPDRRGPYAVSAIAAFLYDAGKKVLVRARASELGEYDPAVASEVGPRQFTRRVQFASWHVTSEAQPVMSSWFVGIENVSSIRSGVPSARGTTLPITCPRRTYRRERAIGDLAWVMLNTWSRWRYVAVTGGRTLVACLLDL